MSLADPFAEFRLASQSSEKEQTRPPLTKLHANFGDYEQSLARIEELLQQHSLEHKHKRKTGESIFELQSCPENEQHPPGKAFIKVSNHGDVTAGCQHDSCKWGFPGFFRKLEGFWPSGKDGLVFEHASDGPTWLRFNARTCNAEIVPSLAAIEFRRVYPELDLNDGVAPTRLHDYLCQLAPQVAFDERELQNILKLARIQVGEEPWTTDPISLHQEMHEGCPYPITALPINQQEQISELCELVKVPTALAAQSLQAAISYAAQGLVNVVRRLDNDELTGPVNTAHLTLAESSERKSSVDNKLMGFLEEHEKELRDQYSQNYRQLSAEHDQWQQHYQNRQAALAKIQRKPKLTDEDHILIHTLNRELIEFREAEPLKPPKSEKQYLPDLFTRNFSIQSLAQVLSRYPSVILNSAEGGQTLGSFAFQKENLLNTLADLNELIWRGAARNHRVGDTGVDVQNARLTVNLMIQPEAAIELFSNPLYRGTGMLARFCVTRPISIAGTRLIDVSKALSCNSLGPTRLSRLTSHFRRLLQTVQLDADYRLVLKPLQMTREGLELWLEYYNQIEKELGSQGVFEDYKDVAGKSAEIAARLSAQFHVINYGTDGEISGEFVLSGVELARWYLKEFLRITGMVPEERALRNAVKLLNWLKTNKMAQDFRKGKNLTLTKLRQFGPRPFSKEQDQLKEALSLLERNHYLRFDEGSKRFKGHPKEFFTN